MCVCACVCVCVMCMCVCLLRCVRNVYACLCLCNIGISHCSIKLSTNAHGHTRVAATIYSCFFFFLIPISRCVMNYSLLNNSVGAVKPNSIGQQLRYFENLLRLTITFEVTLHIQLAPVCTQHVS